jgi:hypothetical protein
MFGNSRKSGAKNGSTEVRWISCTRPADDLISGRSTDGGYMAAIHVLFKARFAGKRPLSRRLTAVCDHCRIADPGMADRSIMSRRRLSMR